MQIKTILHLLGALLLLFSLTMLPPIGVELFYKDASILPYVTAFFVTLLSGSLLFHFFKKQKRELRTRDGFLIVVLFWLVLCFFAALPLMMADKPHDTLTDAMFESVSGFTTTGATVVANVDLLPHAMRYYRQQLQFLGGMGIIVLAVAILPMLGIGGLQLYRAETPGPMKDSKLTPRITQTAKALWGIYVGLTILCAISYYFAGMTLFDAIGESFATVSTGGFSMHDTSFSFYHNPAIELIAILFMLLGSTNFALHFIAFREKSFIQYWRDEEFRLYILLLTVVSCLVTLVLWNHHIYDQQLGKTFLKSFFNVISISTTTGFVSGPFHQWPSFVPLLIMLVAMIGGCAGSTSGGIKMIRALLLKKQTVREIHRLIHPQAVINLKFAKQTLPPHVLQSMWSFIAAFIGIFAVLLLSLMATGLDFTSAFGVGVASLANAGAAMGSLAENFSSLTITAKWLCIFAMLAGRLEIFTLLVLFTPAFWRR